MIAAGTYSSYVLAAYGISALVLGLAGVFVFAAAAAARRELMRLEADGIRRRSGAKAR